MTTSEPKCIHRHTIRTHPSCFAKGLVIETKDKIMQERIRTEFAASPYKRVNVASEPWYTHPEYNVGYFDIEASDLRANIGYMVSYAFKEKGTGEITYKEITQEEVMSAKFDRRLVRECLEDFRKFKIIVTFYGSNFDMKFLRTRALYWQQIVKEERRIELNKLKVTELRDLLEELLPEDRRVPSRIAKDELIKQILFRDYEVRQYDFPSFGEHYHWDLYYAIKRMFSLTSRSLAVVTEFFGIEGKTKFKPHEWTLVKVAHPSIMEALREHNVEDVNILEELHEIINPYKKWTRTNI